MKLMNLIMILAAIQISYFLFYNADMNASASDIFRLGNYTNITANSSYYTDLSNYTTNFTTASLSGYSSQTFWNSALDFVSGGSQTGIIVLLILFAGTFWGLALLYRSELTLLSPMFILFIGIGIIPCISLFYMITSDVGLYVCNINDGGTVQNCLLSSLIGFGTAGMLFIMWFMSCIEWWTARSTG